MNKVRWGIIGCGDVTEVKSGPAFNKIEGSELVAVMRRDGQKAADYAKRHHVPKWYDNAESLINDNEVNAVYVATPPDTHAYYTIKALEAGKPVYVEKPMARNHEECQSMIAAAKKYDVPLFVAYYRRALPGFLKIKELIEAGEIGAPGTVNIKLFKSPSKNEMDGNLPWRVNPDLAGGGHFYDLGSHQLDYLDFLFGPAKEIKGVAVNHAGLYKAEDTVAASIVFENNVIGSCSWCFSASPSDNCDEVEIAGDKGKIRFSFYDFSTVLLTNEKGEKEYPFEQPVNVQFHLIKEVVNELLGKGTTSSHGISGARTNYVMEEIVRDYYKNSENIKLKA